MPAFAILSQPRPSCCRAEVPRDRAILTTARLPPRRLWIHPRTQARVKILGGAKASAKALKELGYTLSELPDFIGGGRTGTTMIDLVRQARHATRHVAPCHAAVVALTATLPRRPWTGELRLQAVAAEGPKMPHTPRTPAGARKRVAAGAEDRPAFRTLILQR